MQSNHPTTKLVTGRSMPTIGLGTWKSKPGEVEKAVEAAIQAGYRHIDGAAIYRNENEVGTGIRNKIADGTVKRDELFVVSKLWNNAHGPDSVMPALKKTLSDLGLEYIDLYLMHWPMGYKDGPEMDPKGEDGKTIYAPTDYLDTWAAMEACVDAGLTRDIGLSNFNSQQVQRLWDACRIKPVCNQVECNPYLNQSRLLKACQEKGIVLVAYAPLGSPDRPWAKPDDPVLLEDPKLKPIASKYGKSVAQVCLRYQLDRGVVVIPKSVTPSRIKENADITDFALTADEMAVLDGFDLGPRGRLCNQIWDKTHQFYPFNIEF